MEILLQNLTLIMAVVGVLAFIVSVITQVFKGVGVLAKIPTDILVFALSIALTVVAYVAYMDYIQQTIIWYMIIAAVLAVFGGIRRDVWMGKVCRIVAAFCKRKKRKDTVIQLSPGAGLSVIWGRLRSPCIIWRCFLCGKE